MTKAELEVRVAELEQKLKESEELRIKEIDAKNHARSELQDVKRINSQNALIQANLEEKIKNMESIIAQLKSENDKLKQEQNKSNYEQQLAILLDKYSVSYRGFLKNVQGALENAVEFEAILQDDIKRLIQIKKSL